MNTKTEKPKSFGPKTETPIEKIAKTAKPKIPMPPIILYSKIPTDPGLLKIRHSHPSLLLLLVL